MKRRVAVTGMGVVSPIGNDLERFLSNLLAGKSGAGPISLFDPATLPTRIAAEVKWDREILRDRKITFALDAARQAYHMATQCGTSPGERLEKPRCSVSMGLGLELFSMDDLCELRAGRSVTSQSWIDRVSFLQTPSDICVHLLAKQYNLNSYPSIHVSACAAGADAIGTAYRKISEGRQDWMLAGGTDSMINPMGVAGFCKIGATTTRNAEPQKASRPFDRDRDGFLLGEGAAVLVLEEFEGALSRGAHIHAEIAGFGNSFDAHGISEPHPEGRGAVQAMTRALQDAGMTPESIGCINAHGTGTPKNDPVETLAIQNVFGSYARNIPICSTKSMLGHLISAAGAVEAAAAILCMEQNMVHPTINLEHQDPMCSLDYVPHIARAHRYSAVMSNSFGFGGQNAALVISKPQV